MNKHSTPSNISCAILVERACDFQRIATYHKGHLLRYWRFYLASVITALLLSATDTPAATITVTNGNDSGLGSLRRAINFASPGDTINFAPSVTAVDLTSGELVINKNLTITGPGANQLTVQRSTNGLDFRIFHVTPSSVTVSISGLTVSNGSVSGGDGDGGGVRSAGVLTLTDSVISNNHAAGAEFLGGNGGGVLNENGTMTITRCTISNNSAQYSTGSSGDCPGGSGGGILNESGGSLTISNSTISDNSFNVSDSFGICVASGGGGGVRNVGSMTITNCTISGNSASGNGFFFVNGGGISNNGSLQVTSSTISYNSAFNSASAQFVAFGGGIFGSGSTATDSSIIALNTAPDGPDFFSFLPEQGLQSMGYNIIGNNDEATIFSQPTDQIGTPAAPIDPLLGPLADNGGPTFTHALHPGSPAINRGDPAAPLQDQRGYGRVGVPDVGAFEFNGGFPRYDFNGDGKPDYVLYNASTHQTAIWYLNNSDYRGGAYGPSVPTGWQPVATADFNSDGKPDCALYNSSTRQTAMWYLNNNVYVRGVYGPTLPIGWRLVGSTDFDGDRKPDYLLFNSITRQSAIWYLNNNVFISGVFGPTIASGWALVVTADFNSDGHPDYVLSNPVNRQTAIWYLNN